MPYPKIFICKKCEKETLNKNRSKNPQYCSRRCQADVSIEKAQIIRICCCCSKEFKKSRGQLSDKNSLKFCSRKCHGLSKTGKNNPMYKNGFSITTKKYAVVTQQGKQKRVHRLIMEEAIGRKLYKHEEVHHKNGDRLDNKIGNLEVWSHSHPAGQKIEDKIQWAIEFIKQYGYEVQAQHDRDVNAACNVLYAGAGIALENRNLLINRNSSGEVRDKVRILRA